MKLRHLVFIEINDDVEKIGLINKSLDELSKKMPGCNKFDFGKCRNEPNYYYFFMDFDSATSRDNYLADPEHERVAKEVIIPNLKNGLKSVIVLDHDKNGRKDIMRLKKSEETTGYILIEHDQREFVEKELIEYCDKIARAKPLVNGSAEEFGKSYPNAMRIKFNPGVDSIKMREGKVFLIEKEKMPKFKG
jgi:Stress responsive A/B Barrel Domain